MTRHDHITEFYLHQAGGGQYYAGSSYQKGHGIGSWLGGLFRTVLPLLKSGATAVGREAARAGAHVLADVASGDTFADSAKRHTGEAVQNLKRKAASAMNGSGRPIKRPKPAPKRHTVAKPRAIMAFMHSASVEAPPTELSLWLSSATQMGEERS
ncbi:PURA Adenylosuccinate synthetase, chloroplastic [Frankliniella fusca]|uniref:PURA Adenylosuccinate synthetase, chloroplastic n=1 Tax=Frankliniella fusca TaxID=407009 RepID=A0AAE1LS82_9NEOP|nr:PURA Adenylosuccinate synthetase, chloroplastic [Frankliniella fusca]